MSADDWASWEGQLMEDDSMTGLYYRHYPPLPDIDSRRTREWTRRQADDCRSLRPEMRRSA